MPPRSAGRATLVAASERGAACRSWRARSAVAGEEKSDRCWGLPRPPPRDVADQVWRPPHGSVAAELFRLIEEENADLIVAGGYGHSRLGEFIFGGVTRELLVASPVCCMLSH